MVHLSWDERERRERGGRRESEGRVRGVRGGSVEGEGRETRGDEKKREGTRKG